MTDQNNDNNQAGSNEEPSGFFNKLISQKFSVIRVAAVVISLVLLTTVIDYFTTLRLVKISDMTNLDARGVKIIFSLLTL